MARRTASVKQNYVSGSAARKLEEAGAHRSSRKERSGRREAVRRSSGRTASLGAAERLSRQESLKREKKLLERQREKELILRDREQSYQAQQERLRSKAVNLDARFLGLLILASVFSLYFSFSYIQMQTEVNSRISSIERKKQNLEQLRAENDALQNSIDTSIDPNEIYRVATQELGMVYAGENQVITYDKTESEYVRQYESIPRY